MRYLECMSFFLRPFVQDLAHDVAHGLAEGGSLGVEPHVGGLFHADAPEVFERKAHGLGRLLAGKFVGETEALIQRLVHPELTSSNDLKRPRWLQGDYRWPLMYRDAGNPNCAPKGRSVVLEIGEGIFFAHGEDCAP